jgi:hypothetical protein
MDVTSNGDYQPRNDHEGSGYSPPSQYMPHPLPPQAPVFDPDICHCSAATFPHRHLPLAESRSITNDVCTSTPRNAILDPDKNEFELLPHQPSVPAQPHWGKYQVDPTWPGFANLMRFDPTMKVVTANMGVASPSTIASDNDWIKQFTELPIELGGGYLPADTPIRQNDHYCQWSDDLQGPPKQSQLFEWWTRVDPAVKAIYESNEGWISTSDLDVFIRVHDCQRPIPDGCKYVGTRGSFTLPLVDRQRIYQKLFHRIEFEDGTMEGFVDDIISSKVYEILRIENFLLMTLDVFRKSFGVEKFPPLTSFVKDLVEIVDSLITGDNRNPSKISRPAINKSFKLDQVTWWSEPGYFGFEEKWARRWSALDSDQFGLINSSKTRRNYICGLFDAMFGIWPAPGQCMLHEGQAPDARKSDYWIHGECPEKDHWVRAENAVPRCINSGLYFWEKQPPQPDVGRETTRSNLKDGASISLEALDAFLIQSRVPFKFVKTSRLDQHLLITNGEDKKNVLIYTDWQRFLMLRHHRVLVDDSSSEYPAEELSRFQLLSRSTRTAKDRLQGTGGDVRYIAYELLRTYALLFYRRISQDGYFKGQAHSWFWWTGEGSSSKEIGENVGLWLEPPLEGWKELIEVFTGLDREARPQSEDFKIFGKRLEALNQELCSWKPYTTWDLIWYRGWVEDEATYLPAIIGFFVIPVTFVSLALSISQVYYAINPNPAS